MTGRKGAETFPARLAFIPSRLLIPRVLPFSVLQRFRRPPGHLAAGPGAGGFQPPIRAGHGKYPARGRLRRRPSFGRKLLRDRRVRQSQGKGASKRSAVPCSRLAVRPWSRVLSVPGCGFPRLAACGRMKDGAVIASVLEPIFWLLAIFLFYLSLGAEIVLLIAAGRVRSSGVLLGAVGVLLLGVALLVALPMGKPTRLMVASLAALACQGALYRLGLRPKMDWQAVKAAKETARQTTLHLILLSGALIFMVPFAWLVV